ncbi:hypothetical protein D3C84_932410 [compost metagenome]
MHPARAPQEREGATDVGDRTDHFKLLDVEAFQVLLDSVGVGPDVARAPLTLGLVHADLPGKRAAQVGGTVGKGFVGPERRRRLDLAGRPQAHFIHVGVQVAETVVVPAARQRDQACQQADATHRPHGCASCSLYR